MHDILEELNAVLLPRGLRIIRLIIAPIPNTSENRSTPHPNAAQNAFEGAPKNTPETPEEGGETQATENERAAKIAKYRQRLSQMMNRS